MGKVHFSRKARLRAIIAISFAFFLTELSSGFYTHSIALIADAFHYLNDLIGFIVALAAVQVSERETSPQDLSFGWARAQLLGAFFNGAFLLALGLSITVQSIERFIKLEPVTDPKVVLIVGCVGLSLNIISAAFLHEHHDHDHGGHSHGHSHSSSETDDAHTHSQPNIPSASFELSLRTNHAAHMHHAFTLQPSGHDLGLLGVLIHLIGDAINNLAVILAALLIMLLHSPKRYYADPALSLFIAIIILLTAVPLTRRSGAILLESAPPGVRLDDIKSDIESIEGVKGVHELHVWRLDQKKAIASAHVVVDEQQEMSGWMRMMKVVGECLHEYGIHSATVQPEVLFAHEDVVVPKQPGANDERSSAERRVRVAHAEDDVEGAAVTVTQTDAGARSASKESLRQRSRKCGMTCGISCEPLMCCNE